MESLCACGFLGVLAHCWDQVTSWPVPLEAGSCFLSLYLSPLSALDGVHSAYTCGWNFKGLASPGKERPLFLSGLVNMIQDTLAAHGLCQRLLNIYCVPHALHMEEGHGFGI